MNKLKWIGLAFFILIFASGCWLRDTLTEESYFRGIEFPDREIVFQSNVDDEYLGVGFINRDGSELIRIPTRDEKLTQMSWYKDQEIILFHKSREYVGHEFPGAGWLGVWKMGAMPIRCNESDVFGILGSVFLLDPEHALVVSGLKSMIVQWPECLVEKVILDLTAQSEATKDHLISSYLSQDGRLWVYTQETRKNEWVDTIHIMDLESGSNREITKGLNATLSPDNQKVAFVRTQPDYRKYREICIANIDGTNIQPIIDLGLNKSDYNNIDPIPYWSPDGEWLLYHRCISGMGCLVASDFNVFTFNLITNEEKLLYEGGLYPSWAIPGRVTTLTID